MYIVVETTCFPASWKVELKKWPGRDNATCNYFRTKEAAIAEARRKNKLHYAT